MTFGSPTYIALGMPSRVADYAQGLRERYDVDLAPLPVEIALGIALYIIVGRIRLPILF